MISITANGVEYPLPVQTAELQTLLDSMYDAGRLSELVNPHSILSGALDSDWPHPPASEWPRPRLGALYWPVVGLAHYAFGCFLIDEYTLGQIRAGMATAASNTVIVKFTDDPTDDAETARSVSMQFLATRPLVRTTSGALTTDDNGTAPVDAWVLLLVDDRYRLLHTSVTSLTTTAWSDIFAAASITVADVVDSDYLAPGVRWSADKVKGRSLAWLMDIAALSVGSRIVNVPGASPALQRPTGTRKTALSDAHTAAAARFFGGGPIEDADVDAGMPSDARVTFCAPTETSPASVDVTVQTAYAWPGTAYVTHWADAPASTSSGNRSALAAQWEADWSAWQHGCYDTQYSGLVAAPASGFCWAVEWYHDAETARTHFVRPPHWYGYLLSTQEGVTPGITVEEVDGSPSYTGSVTLRFDQADGFVVTQPGAGIARVDLQSASATQNGIVDTTTQTFGGVKTFDGNVFFAGSAGWSFSGGGLWLGSGLIETDSGQQLVMSQTGGGPLAGISGNLILTLDTWGAVLYVGGSDATAHAWAGRLTLATGQTDENAAYAVTRDSVGVQVGVDGTLKPGMAVTGGIITSAGSGSFLADPGDGLAGGTYP